MTDTSSKQDELSTGIVTEIVNETLFLKPNLAAAHVAQPRSQLRLFTPEASLKGRTGGVNTSRPGTMDSSLIVDRMHYMISGGTRYSNIGSTSTNVQAVPPYVLDRLSKVRSEKNADVNGLPEKEKLVRVDTIHQGSNDPFIQTFKDDSNSSKWHDFLGTVAMPSSSIQNSKRDDADEIMRSYDLDGRWKGEDRLVSCFQNTSSSTTSSFEKERSSDLEGGEGSKEHKFGGRHYKEKARYWIQENRKNWKPRLIESLLSNSYIPLVFRLITLFLSIVTLGIGGSLMSLDAKVGRAYPPSPILAVCVQSVAIIYILYTTYDEFYSQPLGLRDPTTKIRLILLDLLFIIFGSANLGLGYEELFESDGACLDAGRITNPPNAGPLICKRQRALTSFMFLILIAWCITFTISIFRVVHVVADTRDRS